jgi:DNA-binding XRE family transcriptional regulator
MTSHTKNPTRGHRLSGADRLARQLVKTKRQHPSGRRVVWICTLLSRRTALDLTLRDIERAIGVSSAVLSTIEHGTDPQLTTARKIAEFFGCSVEEMWPSRRDGQ